MSGTVVNTHSVAKSMEKAGFFVIESAVSASTLWGIKEGKLTLVDIVGEKKVIALPIGKRNIDKLCEELRQIKNVYGDKLK